MFHWGFAPPERLETSGLMNFTSVLNGGVISLFQ